MSEIIGAQKPTWVWDSNIPGPDANKKEVQIFAPNYFTFIVQVKHAGVWRPAKNWIELHEEARQVAEPQAIERWAAHQQRLMEHANRALASGSLEDLMKVPTSPGWCYECPRWLAEKAIEDR